MICHYGFYFDLDEKVDVELEGKEEKCLRELRAVDGELRFGRARFASLG